LDVILQSSAILYIPQKGLKMGGRGKKEVEKVERVEIRYRSIEIP
jgi:hypothetical protein